MLERWPVNFRYPLESTVPKGSWPEVDWNLPPCCHVCGASPFTIGCVFYLLRLKIQSNSTIPMRKPSNHSTGIHPWIDRLFSLTPAVLLHHGWTTTDDAKTSCRGHDIGWYVRCLNFGRIVSKYDFQLPYTSSWSDMSKLGTSCGIYILYVQETSYLYTTTITTGFCWHSSETPILGCFVVPANSWAISGTANCCWRCPRLNHLASSGTLLHQTFLAIEQPQEASLVTVSQCGISIPNKTMSPWVNHNMFHSFNNPFSSILESHTIPPTIHLS